MPGTLPLRYALPNLFILLTIAALLAGGYWIWLAIALVAVVAGPIDEAIGDSRKELSPAARIFFTANLYATLPLMVILTVLFLHYWTAGDPIGLKAWLAGHGIAFTNAPSLLSWGPVAGATFAAALFYAATAVIVAHELIHWTNNRLAMAMGRALLGFTVGTSFAIAHVYGHHRSVGTLKDHATARRGESLLAFAVRCSIVQNTASFGIEAARLRRKGIHPWSWRNRALTSFLYPLAIAAGAWLLAGFRGVVGFLIAAAIGKLIHRTIDYTQHYGIVRMEGTPIEARHSWDCHRAVSNGLFYNLPRHADHHMFAGRRGWELRAVVDDAPLMPYGYKVMLLIALIPPLWHRVIDPRLAEWDRTLASDAERALIRERGWEIRSTPASAPARVPS